MAAPADGDQIGRTATQVRAHRQTTIHKIRSAGWTTEEGWTFRTVCGEQLTSATRTTRPATCQHCAPQVVA